MANWPLTSAALLLCGMDAGRRGFLHSGGSSGAANMHLPICERGLYSLVLSSLVCAILVELKNRTDQTETEFVGFQFYKEPDGF